MGSGMKNRRTLGYVLIVAGLLICCGTELDSGHSQTALLRAVELQRLDSKTEGWLVESRMEYSYNSLGQDTAKTFLMRNGDSFTLALRYHIDYPSKFTMIEVRDDCEQDVCEKDTKKVVIKDTLDRNSLDSTYSWDQSSQMWVPMYLVRYNYDAMSESDTVWHFVQGQPKRKVISSTHSGMKLIWELAIDSSREWKKIRSKNCQMRGAQSVHCKERFMSGNDFSETWISYTEFDSIQMIRTRTVKGLRDEIREYDAHRHLLVTKMGDSLRLIRFYK